MQAIPMYSMSCFKLPITLCHEIEAMVSKFWWGQRGTRRHIHWVKWSTMCRPKSLGGMGFQELQKFNDTMLGKQVWRLLQNQDSLFVKFFKTKFFPHGTIFYAKENKGSFAWKSILKGRDVIRQGLKWRIRNGQANAMVSILINHKSMCWKEDEIDRLFIPEEAAAIKAIPLSLFNQEDLHFWPHTRDRVFLVRSAYCLLLDQVETTVEGSSSEGENLKVWKSIWSLRVPNWVKFPMW